MPSTLDKAARRVATSLPIGAKAPNRRQDARVYGQGWSWDDAAMREKYHVTVKDQYPNVETIRSLTKITYTHLRT